MLKNYVKIAIKVLLRRKFFTFISLFATGFTLVVLMVVAAALDHQFAPMPPEVRQDRTLGVYRAMMMGKNTVITGSPGYKFLNNYVRTLQGLERVSIFTGARPVSSFKDGMEVTSELKRTDGEYWKILEFQFLEGGPFTSDDDANGNFVCVINASTRGKFFGNGAALGQMIEAGRQRFRVVGVVPDVPRYRSTPFADIWVPVSTSADAGYREEIVGDFQAMLLARDASDFDRIKRDFNALLFTVPLPSSDFTMFSSAAETALDDAARDFVGVSYSTDEGSGDRAIETHTGEAAAMIAGAALLFMLLPTVNLININISRIAERASEIGVRKSFGASSGTLVGQFIVENLILTAIGGVIGFIGAALVLQSINASGIIPYAHFGLNLRVFGYGLALIGVFGVVSGVWPAWKMSRMHPVLALKGAVR